LVISALFTELAFRIILTVLGYLFGYFSQRGKKGGSSIKSSANLSFVYNSHDHPF